MLLTPHFSDAELGVAGLPEGTGPVIAATNTARILEGIRAAVGVPLDVTSGYRDASHNAEVGGVYNSQHMTGNAADVVPRGLLLGDAYDRFAAALEAGQIPDFGQVIFYPFDLPPGHSHGHIHASTRVGTSSANKVLVAVDNGAGSVGYTFPDAALVAEMPRGASPAAVAAIVGIPFALLVVLLVVALIIFSHT